MVDTGEKVLVFVDEAKEVVRCTCQTVRPWRNLPKHLANSHKLTNRQITEMMDSLGRDWKKTGSMWSVNVKTAERAKVLKKRKKKTVFFIKVAKPRPNRSQNQFVECPVCAVKLADKKCVKRHMKTKHGMQKEDIDSFNIVTSVKTCK